MGKSDKRSPNASRPENLLALAKRMFPTINGNNGLAREHLIDVVVKQIDGRRDKRSIDRFFSGESVASQTRNAVLPAIKSLSGNKVTDALLLLLDHDPAEFAAALDAIPWPSSQEAEARFETVEGALLGWEAANRSWYHGGKPRIGNFVGVHQVFGLSANGGKVERQILTITQDGGGLRACLRRSQGPDYKGVVLENDSSLMMVLQKQETDQMAICYILLQRRSDDTHYRPGILCKEAMGSSVAHRIIVKTGSPGDQPGEFTSHTNEYKILKPALTLGCGQDDPPALFTTAIWSALESIEQI